MSNSRDAEPEVRVGWVKLRGTDQFNLGGGNLSLNNDVIPISKDKLLKTVDGSAVATKLEEAAERGNHWDYQHVHYYENKKGEVFACGGARAEAALQGHFKREQELQQYMKQVKEKKQSAREQSGGIEKDMLAELEKMKELIIKLGSQNGDARGAMKINELIQYVKLGGGSVSVEDVNSLKDEFSKISVPIPEKKGILASVGGIFGKMTNFEIKTKLYEGCDHLKKLTSEKESYIKNRTPTNK